MSIQTVDDRLSVGPQIAPADLATLARAGFRSVICARPDREEPGQPGQAEIAAAARAAGLGFRYIPVVPGQMTDAAAADFGRALRDLPGPVFAYCRSGARARLLNDRAAVLSRTA